MTVPRRAAALGEDRGRSEYRAGEAQEQGTSPVPLSMVLDVLLRRLVRRLSPESAQRITAAMAEAEEAAP